MDSQSVLGGAGDQLPATKTILIVIAVLVVLAILIIAAAAWRRNHSVPDCSKYPGDAGVACAAGVAKCNGNAACLNAIAQCMPVGMAIQNAATSADKINAVVANLPQVSACSSAISKTDPAMVSNAIKSIPQVCMSSSVGPYVRNINPDAAGATFVRDANVARDLAVAVAPAVPWAIRVAQGVPACPPAGAVVAPLNPSVASMK